MCVERALLGIGRRCSISAVPALLTLGASAHHVVVQRPTNTARISKKPTGLEQLLQPLLEGVQVLIVVDEVLASGELAVEQLARVSVDHLPLSCAGDRHSHGRAALQQALHWRAPRRQR